MGATTATTASARTATSADSQTATAATAVTGTAQTTATGATTTTGEEAGPGAAAATTTTATGPADPRTVPPRDLPTTRAGGMAAEETRSHRPIQVEETPGSASLRNKCQIVPASTDISYHATYFHLV